MIDDAANRLALVHELERVIDVGDWHTVRDKLVDHELALDVALDEAGQVARLVAAKGAAGPGAAGDEHERLGANLLTSGSDANDDTLAPALVRALERLAHGDNGADALERKVGAAVGLLDEHVDNGAIGKVEGIDALGAAELGGKVKLARIGVDADDALGASGTAALGNGGTDRTETPDGTNRARLHFGRIEGGAKASGDAAAEETTRVEFDIGTNDSAGNLGQDSVLGEGRATHEVKESLALAREARSAVGHEAFALVDTKLLAKIRFAAETKLAFLALWHIAHDDVVADLDTRHLFANRFHHTASFVPQNRREDSFWIAASKSVRVCVTHAARMHSHSHLACLWWCDFNFFNA